MLMFVDKVQTLSVGCFGKLYSIVDTETCRVRESMEDARESITTERTIHISALERYDVW